MITVTEIDLSDSDNPQVFINDSGIPNGVATSYPLDKFLDAWENSDFQYTATDDPLPSLERQVSKMVRKTRISGEIFLGKVGLVLELAPLSVRQHS